MLSPEDYNNEKVFSPATLKLGEILWRILAAQTLMEERTTRQIEVGGTDKLKSYRAEYTEFGREVGKDEITWWISKKEKNIEELRQETNTALQAAQKLKVDSDKISKNKPKAYEALLSTLRDFADGHAAEIEALNNYVCWLSKRDQLAPAILFNYKVWGSTKRADRYLEFDPNAPENDETIKRLTEIALGLTRSKLPALRKAEYEIGADMYAASDPEDEREIIVPIEQAASLAADNVFDSCSEFFEFFRDSLRNIMFEIEKFVENNHLLGDDTFWRAFILKAAQAKTVEPLLWDFKETVKFWKIPNGPEREKAKIIFAEDVASFANANGGVLIIGVTDNRKIVGVGQGHELEQNIKYLHEVLKKHLDFGREIFRIRQVLIPDENGDEKICLVVIVANASEAVGVDDGNGHYSYPIRRHSGLERVSRLDASRPKTHQKSENHDFLNELIQFTYKT